MPTLRTARLRPDLAAWIALSLCAASGALGCGDDGSAATTSDSACGHQPEQLFGGWSGRISLRACFAEDGRMWVGDSVREITGRNYCTISPDACSFDCTDPDGGSPYSGTLQVSADQLLITVTDCPAAPDSCAAPYTRDSTVECE